MQTAVLRRTSHTALSFASIIASITCLLSLVCISPTVDCDLSGMPCASIGIIARGAPFVIRREFGLPLSESQVCLGSRNALSEKQIFDARQSTLWFARAFVYGRCWVSAISTVLCSFFALVWLVIMGWQPLFEGSEDLKSLAAPVMRNVAARWATSSVPICPFQWHWKSPLPGVTARMSSFELALMRDRFETFNSRK